MIGHPRTYGTLSLHTSQWVIRAEPHVMIKLKRLFPRLTTYRTGVVGLQDTLDVARDLEWFTTRYPLRTDDVAAARLAAQAEKHRATEETILGILNGQHTLSGQLPEPARPPRPYQQQAADIVLATGRLLLADDVGLGKTFSGLLVLRNPAALPALVVTLTHLPQQWLGELKKSLPWLHGHVVTKGTPYDPSAKRGSNGRAPDVLIMPYSKLAGWADHLAGEVRTVIFDEIQELRHGTATLKGTAAAQVADKADYRLGLSATPVYGYGGEIHNIMGVLAPDALGSRNEFLREWSGTETGQGHNIKVADPAALGTYLRDQGLLLRRTRKDVHRELPEPIEVEQPVDTNHDTIEQVAQDVAATARLLLGETATREERFRAAGEMDWRMRQATGIAKAPFVAEYVKLLLESEQRVVMFGWHRRCYEVWGERLRGYRPVLYTGTESPAQKAASARAFCGGQSRVLMMSLRSGAGLDGLQDWCSVAVFGELDWSPEIHRQCLGRLARDGQESTVAAYYMVSDDGTDPLMAEVLGLKKQQAAPIRDPDAPLFTELVSPTDRTRILAAEVLARVRKQAS